LAREEGVPSLAKPGLRGGGVVPGLRKAGRMLC